MKQIKLQAENLTEDARSGGPLTGDAQSGRPLTGNVQSGRPLTKDIQSGRPLTEDILSGGPLTEDVQSGRPLTGFVQSGRPLTEHVQSGRPLTEAYYALQTFFAKEHKADHQSVRAGEHGRLKRKHKCMAGKHGRRTWPANMAGDSIATPLAHQPWSTSA